jgi:integrase
MKGTVIKRGRKWAVVIDLGRDPRGKRIRKWHSGYLTKKAAEAARVELLSGLQRGEYVPPSTITVGRWLADWLDGRQAITDTTRTTYRWESKRITDNLGPVRLRDLSPSMVAGFYRQLTNGGLAAKSVKNTHGVLHRALEDAVRAGIVARNVADHQELPRAERPDTMAWTAGELTTFLAHVVGHRLYAAWALMCSTGMRRSEVLGLRWSNIDMEAGRLAVVDTVVVVNHRPVLRIEETKSRRSRRSVALDLGTVAILREHRAAQAAERLLAGPAWRDLGMVFSDELGQVVNPVWFTRATKSLARAAGVPPLTPHAAGRHTWATLALSSGIPAKVVADRFGHSTVAVTLDRYSHVIEGMDREAAEKVATLFR